jgi:predicted N-acetyltransferase YhbS
MTFKNKTMLSITPADIHSKDYKQFKNWVIKEWGKIDQLADEENTYDLPLSLLAFSQNRLVGGLSFIHYKNPESEDTAIWINTLYIDAEFRGQKIGQALIIEAEKTAKNAGYDCLYVYTNKPKLYETIGWSILSRDQDDFVLKKKIL